MAKKKVKEKKVKELTLAQLTTQYKKASAAFNIAWAAREKFVESRRAEMKILEAEIAEATALEAT